ncbi:MAG: Recombination-associated protein RdgC [Pseudomonadota bacterium]|nr:Recombination-associated protein RdgC [Pseudomonadota bacterium]
MWLRQFQVFNISFDFQKDLAPHLHEHALAPCPAHARTSFGWKTVSPDQYSENIQSYSFCYFGKEERILPQSVVNHTVETKARELKEARGFPLKRHEKQQLKQDTEFNLLPKAFCVQKHQIILFDQMRQRMFIQSTSQQQLELIISLLHKTIPQAIEITPITPKDHFIQDWQTWLTEPQSLPHFLQLADKLALIDEDNQRKQIKCQGYNWEEDSAFHWIKQGFIPNEISLIWREMIQFHITPKFGFKRVAALPSFKDQIDAQSLEEQEQNEQLTQLLLVGHTYQQLIDDMLTIST